jgi:DNA-binding GntR family transcriptional regulator
MSLRNPPPAPPIDFRSLAEEAYARLEEMIITLELAPGAVVSESDLIPRLALGRTPLREAMQRLADQGLLQILPRRGILVTEVNLSSHLGMLETRRVLDRLIAAAAARRATPEQRSALEEIAETMARAAKKNDLREFMAVDRQCDALVADAARNPSATRAVLPLHALSRRFWFMHRNDGDLARAASLHIALMTAIRIGVPKGAEDASDDLLDYLESFSRASLDHFGKR